MLKLRKVAVTGGLSCGKSLVCRFFKDLGAYVVSADEIVHNLLSPTTIIGQKVIKLFGESIVVDGKIERSAIAKIAFKNKLLLHSLEKLIHPAVLIKIEEHYQYAINQSKAPLFIAEIPLLFEAELEKKFDATIAVWAEPHLCKKRFTAATGLTEREYDKRMANQMSPQEKVLRANYVIKNSESKDETEKEVKRIFLKLTESNNRLYS